MRLARLVKESIPDVICLQETKVEDTKFPTTKITALGYPQQIIYGQKSYHGVAICSRVDLADGKRRDWSGKFEARHVYCRLDPNVELHNFYVPAGGNEPNPLVNETFFFTNYPLLKKCRSGLQPGAAPEQFWLEILM